MCVSSEKEALACAHKKNEKSSFFRISGAMLSQFCGSTKGTEIGGYCYSLQSGASVSTAGEYCSKQQGELLQSVSPELLSMLYQNLNIPKETMLTLGFQLVEDECGHLVPDPNTTPQDVIAKLSQSGMTFTGDEGCAMLNMMSPGTFQAFGGECYRVRDFFCRFSAPSPSWPRPSSVAMTLPSPAMVPVGVPEPSREMKTCEYRSCYVDGTERCGTEDGGTCICKKGWDGVSCEEKISHCDPNPCVFGSCHENATGFRCACISGFTGLKCDIANGTSYHPDQLYNNTIQQVGCIWVLFAAIFSLLLYFLLYDATPEGTLKRHFLMSLIAEHVLIMCFRSPAIFGIDPKWCRWTSLAMLYFRWCNTILGAHHTAHIFYIMTGVTYGNWGWNGSWHVFLITAWAAPIPVCVLVWYIHFDYLATGYSCMLDWDTNVSRWLVSLMFIGLYSCLNLEQAAKEQHLQPIYTGNIVDRRQLAVAKAGRIGTGVVVISASCSYVFTSQAVFSGLPKYYECALACNLVLSVSIMYTYVSTNPYVFAYIKRSWGALVNKIRGRPAAPVVDDEEEVVASSSKGGGGFQPRRRFHPRRRKH